MAAKRPRQGVQRTKVSFVIVVFSTCAIVPLFVIFRARLCPDSNKGQTVMAALDRVESFLVSRKGEAYCEQCIQNELGIPRRRYVRDALFLLRLDRCQRFIQLRTPCSMCGDGRNVSASR
jgi:hypothetical protein